MKTKIIEILIQFVVENKWSLNMKLIYENFLSQQGWNLLQISPKFIWNEWVGVCPIDFVFTKSQITWLQLSLLLYVEQEWMKTVTDFPPP